MHKIQILPKSGIHWLRFETFFTRVGITDDCPQKNLFHHPRDVIITSQMANSEVVIISNVIYPIYCGTL